MTSTAQAEGLMVPENVANKLPAMMRNELAKLGLPAQQAFVETYQRRAKSRGWGYLMWFLGWHYAYTKNWGTQILFWLTLHGLLVWWVVDLFRVGRIIDDFNRDVGINTLRDVKMINS